MNFRVFISLVVLASIFLAYMVIQQMRATHALVTVPAGYAQGPENADLTFVEFFDYTSDKCRSVDPILQEALKKDGHVRYIPRPVPVDGTGEKYVQFAYAAGEQGKFMQTHAALIADFRALDDTRKAQLAQSLGLDLDKLNKDMTGQNVVRKMKENLWLTQAYGTTGLPQFIAGKIVYQPTQKPTVQDFLSLFNEARGRQ